MHHFNYRPGFARINLPFFMSDEGIDYVLKSVSMVAEHGWKLLPQVCFILIPIYFSLSATL